MNPSDSVGRQPSPSIMQAMIGIFEVLAYLISDMPARMAAPLRLAQQRQRNDVMTVNARKELFLQAWEL